MSCAAITAPSTGPGGGTLARVGRAKLRAELTAPPTLTDTGPRCDCAKCLPSGLTDIEAQHALRHVPAADAVAFANGLLTLVSFTDCEHCGAWVPTFIETDPDD